MDRDNFTQSLAKNTIAMAMNKQSSGGGINKLIN